MVLSGSVLAQLIQLLASPILTRVFDPTEIGALTVFLAFSQVALPAIGGKYEVAMVLPRSERNAKLLLGIALRINLLISLGVLCVLLFPASVFFSNENAELLSNWIWLIPVYIWLAGNVIILQYALNRAESFGRLGVTRIAVAFFTVAISISLGVYGMGVGGLIIGAFTGQLLTMILLLFWNRSSIGWCSINWSPRHCALLKKYRDFPMFNASSSLLDGITLALPILVIGKYFSGDVVGWFGLMYRVASAPVSLVSSSISQVNLRFVAQAVRDGASPLPHILRTASLLFALSVLPLVIILVWGPELFGLVFGSSWETAGEYARFLAPAFAMRFIASPLSSTLGATQNNRLGMIWKLLAFVTTVTVLAGSLITLNPNTVILALGISDFCLYVLYLGFIVYAAVHPRNA